jgi:hypothetical protein
VSVSIGYEDGRQYEEINDVQLQVATIEEEIQLDYIDQLQQVQQQQQKQHATAATINFNKKCPNSLLKIGHFYV